MNRHSIATDTLGAAQTLLQLVDSLAYAVREAEFDGKDPCTDPAVMLLSAQVNFMTHADVATDTIYNTLIEACHAQAEVQLSMEAH